MWRLFGSVLLCVLCAGGEELPFLRAVVTLCWFLPTPGVAPMAGAVLIGDQLILEEDYNDSYVPMEQGE